jgi:hypothetical protein
VSAVLDCGIAEKAFNPFYVELLRSLEPHSVKTAFKLRLSSVAELTVGQIRVAAMMAAGVAVGCDVGLSLLRGTKLSKLDEKGRVFGKVFFREVFTTAGADRINVLFERARDGTGFQGDLRKCLSKHVALFLERRPACPREKLAHLRRAFQFLE